MRWRDDHEGGGCYHLDKMRKITQTSQDSNWEPPIKSIMYYCYANLLGTSF